MTITITPEELTAFASALDSWYSMRAAAIVKDCVRNVNTGAHLDSPFDILQRTIQQTSEHFSKGNPKPTAASFFGLNK